jgi:tripartite-type tricarboxylate transporter receptor subunit TctC
MQRRRFLGLSSALLANSVFGTASAQTEKWPERPVKLVVPYAPGGASDIVARPWSEALSKAFGQQFVVENRGGAAGMIGTEAVSKAAPDGYTFLLTPCGVLNILPLLRNVPYDPQKSFKPAGRLGSTLSGWVIHPSVGPKTFPEMVAYAKANPGKLSYGSAGSGSLTHLRLEKMKYKTGVDILHVPYRGSADALNDLLANNIQLMAEINPLPHVKAGKLTLLSMNAEERSADFPDTPTLKEYGYTDLDLLSWYAIWAPAATPAPIMERLYGKIAEIARSEEMGRIMRAFSGTTVSETPAQTSALLASDLEINAAVIKGANIKLE